MRIEGQRIVDVSHGSTLDAPGNISRLDAGGGTLLPGLIDAHVHASLTTLDLARLRRPATRVGIEAKKVLEGRPGRRRQPHPARA